MKKININKINKKIINLHQEYCKVLMPEIVNINGEDKRKKLKDDEVKLLCCKYPFDFNKPHQNYLNDDIWAFYRNSNRFNQRNIDYRTQYKRFRTRTDSNWNALELIKQLNVDICPYCGINYVKSVKKKNGETKTIVTLDHYLTESEYPFLAMNIYNLIPSCRNCNSVFKFQKEDPIIYPYEEALEEFIKFRIKDVYTVIDMIINGKINFPADIEIITDMAKIIKSQKDLIKKRLENHVAILELETRYNNFQNIAKSLIKKRYMYNRTYLNKLETIGNLQNGQLECFLIKQDIFGKDEVFSKFKSDIWKQLSKKYQ